MGTRSACGVCIDGTLKLSYNQYDGYPEGVGNEICDEWKYSVHLHGYDTALEVWRVLARALVLVDEDGVPDENQIAILRKEGLVVNNTADWYWALRDLQNSVLRRLHIGFATEANDFPARGMFCEWAYVFDLDNEVFEVYQGMRKAPPKAGRWKMAWDGSNEPVQHGLVANYPCDLIATFPLNEVAKLDFVLSEKLACSGVAK